MSEEKTNYPDELDDLVDLDEAECPTCCGEGLVEYLDAPEVWGEDCPSRVNHWVTCTNCGGSGERKDCRFG